jgi:hypothetical protein
MSSDFLRIIQRRSRTDFYLFIFLFFLTLVLIIALIIWVR